MASADVFRFNLPPGRIVSGSPTNLQTKDMQGRPKDHPNIYFAVAVPKNSPPVKQRGDFVAGIGDILAEIAKVAQRGYQSQPQILAEVNKLLAGRFSWKIEDGDTPENQKKEGWAGCWIFKYSTTLGVPNCCDGNNQQIDPAQIKCGFYVDVASSVTVNEQLGDRAGLYMNPDVVRLLGYAPEIRTGMTADQAFGAPAAYIPPGASPTPVAAGAPPQSGGGWGGAQAPAPATGGYPPSGQGFTPQPNPTAAGGPGAPATGGWGPAPSADQPGSGGTVSPSNVQQHYPGAAPVTGWGQPR